MSGICRKREQGMWGTRPDTNGAMIVTFNTLNQSTQILNSPMTKMKVTKVTYKFSCYQRKHVLPVWEVTVVIEVEGTAVEHEWVGVHIRC